MTTIMDTSVLHWLSFDEIGAELWKLALTDSENQNWNSTDLNNGTTILGIMSKQSANSSLISSPAQLGLATGLLLSLLINSRIWTTKANREGPGRKVLFGDPKAYQWILHLTPSSSFTFASSKTFILPYLYLLPFFAFILLLPLFIIFAIILLPFAIYRFAVYIHLESTADKHVKRKLLSGADAVWTFNESNKCYSVINALIILEGKPEIFKLRNIFRERLGAFPKLRMRHSFTLGYATWHEDCNLDLGNLVQWLPGKWGDDTDDEEIKGECKKTSHSTIASSNIKTISKKGENRHNCFKERSYEKRCKSNLTVGENIHCKKWNRETLCKIVEDLCNTPLPQDHTCSWEARIGCAMPWDDGRLQKDDKSVTETVFPILFRIHHSIGDGASLLQLLMSTLTDDKSMLLRTNCIQNPEESSKITSLTRPLTLRDSPKNNKDNTKTGVIISNTEAKETNNSLITPKFNKRTVSHCHKNQKVIEHPQELYITANKDMSSFPDDQIPLTEQDNPKGEKECTFLYGRSLSGRKFIRWDSTSVTVEEIKKIRAATGVKFTEVLLSAVSAALSGYWEARKNNMLNDIVTKNKLSKHRSRRQHMEEYNERTSEAECDEEWDKLEDVTEESDDKGFQVKEKNTKMTSKNEKAENPPSSIKLVVPAILGSLFQKQKFFTNNGCNELENLFSVAVMTLPIGKSGGCPLERLSKVSDASGYMMPLRKESVAECKSKLNHDILFNRKASNTSNYSKVMEKSTLSSSESKEFQFNLGVTLKNIINNEESSPKLYGEYPEKTALVNPHRSDVLTYYYTRKSEKVLKSKPQVILTFKNDSTVEDKKNGETKKLSISRNKPYVCPTTVVFTHNDQSDTISHQCKEKSTKCSLQIQEKCKQDVCIKKFSDENVSYAALSNSRISKNSKYLIKSPDTTVKNDDKNYISRTRTVTQISSKLKTFPSASFLQLQSSPTIQHLLTRWLALDIVATILPSFLAAPMMSVASKGVAVVMSNLPGPPKRLHSILGGHSMKEIVFWAPHRGYTGLGITIISYDGRLHIGLMADMAVVPTRRGAEFILNTILDELHSLAAAVSHSH